MLIRHLFFTLTVVLMCLWPLSGGSYPTTGNPGGSGNRFLIDGHLLELPGINFGGWTNLGDFDPEDENDYCLNQTYYNVAPGPCNTLAGFYRLQAFAGAGAFVDKCVVHIGSFAGWSAGDVLVYQLILTEEPGAAVVDLGDVFTVQNAACAGAANCADAIGSYEWQVDGTVSGSTLDLAGALTSGGIGITIDVTSDDVDTDADAFNSVHCTMYPIL